MFWSGNYIVVRELKFLLKEENVTLSQVLEADDILQECKADNKNLMQFLTRPDILAELISLIIEEPPQNVELTAQYRLASIACEVLTSDLSTLSDKLSMDVTQMNRLCDFICKPPPLNPLLASYFSKTVEMLLERSTKQDWYLYHIVCLRVLDFFKSRRDFLPNLLRHMATSAIADTFKYFTRLDDLFNKIVMEWFEEHQLLESLIQVVCGGYLPEDVDEKGQRDESEKQLNHKDTANDTDKRSEEEPPRATLPLRLQAVASANAAALLCDVIAGADPRTRTQDTLTARLQSEECVRQLLQSMFTSPPGARGFAVVSGCRLLLALLAQEPILNTDEREAERCAVELAVAPHLPLLHQALLQDPRGPNSKGVGLPRLHLASLVAQLTLSALDEVCNALRALGTPGVLIDMLFSFPDNNFLHGAVYTMVKHALHNRVYCTQYTRHLLIECDLLTRLMDVYEEYEDKKPAGDNETPVPRAAYMGHVIMMLERIAKALDQNDGQLLELLPAPLAERWTAFSPGFGLKMQQRNGPLGGYYPSENIYEGDSLADNLSAEYEFQDMAGAEHGGDELAPETLDMIPQAVSAFWERASQRYDDDAWDDTPTADGDAAADDQTSDTWLPWEQESGVSSTASASAGWAQFESLAAPPAPVDPFADSHAAPSDDEEFSARWPQPAAPPPHTAELERSVERLQLDASSVSLATNLLTAMSALPPHQLADLVSNDLDHVMPTDTQEKHDEKTESTPGNADEKLPENAQDASGNTDVKLPNVVENVARGNTDLPPVEVESVGASSNCDSNFGSACASDAVGSSSTADSGATDSGSNDCGSTADSGSGDCDSSDS